MIKKNWENYAIFFFCTPVVPCCELLLLLPENHFDWVANTGKICFIWISIELCTWGLRRPPPPPPRWPTEGGGIFYHPSIRGIKCAVNRTYNNGIKMSEQRLCWECTNVDYIRECTVSALRYKYGMRWPPSNNIHVRTALQQQDTCMKSPVSNKIHVQNVLPATT